MSDRDTKNFVIITTHLGRTGANVSESLIRPTDLIAHLYIYTVMQHCSIVHNFFSPSQVCLWEASLIKSCNCFTCQDIWGIRQLSGATPWEKHTTASAMEHVDCWNITGMQVGMNIHSPTFFHMRAAESDRDTQPARVGDYSGADLAAHQECHCGMLLFAYECNRTARLSQTQ